MSAEYSVEEVRAHARMLRECRINTEATRDRQQDKLADICDAYADLLERIAADESAVCSPMLTECPRCKNSHSVALADPKCWMTHPPAQAAQVELPTEMSPNAAASYRLGWRDALAAQPRAVPDPTILYTTEEVVEAQEALRKYNRTLMGEVIDQMVDVLLAAAPSPGESDTAAKEADR